MKAKFTYCDYSGLLSQVIIQLGIYIFILLDAIIFISY
jgi:hypothetical protein